MLDTEDMLSSSAGETAEGVEGATLVHEPAERGASADQPDEAELRTEEAGEFGTTCIEGGDCVYMVRTPEGFAACGIEVAHRAGATDFKKPISCELYPIRVDRDEARDFEALNYDRWDICAAACALGAKHKMPVFRFVKSALIRKYGAGFYEQLEAYYALLALAENQSVLMEEYAREMIVLEELHLDEVDKMLRQPGDLAPFQP